MKRASTTAHYFIFPIDAANISNVLITYSQRGVIILEKTEKDMAVKDNVWSVVLTQRETRRFIANDYAYVQARLIGVNGASAPSDVVVFPVEGVLNDEIIGYAVQDEHVSAESIGESQTFRMTFSEAIEMLDVSDAEFATAEDIENIFDDVPESEDVYATNEDIENLFEETTVPEGSLPDEDASDSTTEETPEEDVEYTTDADIFALFADVPVAD